MSIVGFISAFKKSLPEADWPWVFSALSFDPVVWDNLGGELGLRALERRSSEPGDYSPAVLALLALGIDIRLDTLRALPVEETRLAEPAESQLSSSLAQAGWAALQLRDARRKNGSWEVLLRQKARVPALTLACLYGMLPDPAELLQAAYGLDEDDSARPDANPALHALLANPLHPQAHIEALNELLSDLPRSERLTLIGQVHRFRPDLAPTLAQVALDREPPLGGGLPDRSSGLGQIEKLLRAARLHRLADDAEQALGSLKGASQAARRLQAEMAAQVAQVSAQKDGVEASLESWKQAVELDPDSPDHRAGLVMALLEAGQISQAKARLAEKTFESPHVGILLAGARLALLSGEKEVARKAALLALESFASGPASAGAELPRLLLQLEAPAEAARAAELALRDKPNDGAQLAILARARLAIHRPAEAAQAAHLAAALQPQNPDLRRLLAECLEMAGDWEAALLERTSLLEHMQSLPSSDPAQDASPEDAAQQVKDLRDLAACSLYAGKALQAAEICRQLLEQDENDGLTWSVLGQATAEMGDVETAFQHLERATQIAPELSAPWLALAHHHQSVGQTEKALETLQAACLAAPERPEILLALGEAYLAQNAPTQALASFRSAASSASGAADGVSRTEVAHPQIASRSPKDQIALRLGQTLHRLGHLPAARQVLEDAYRRSPEDGQIAECYAQVLLALGELLPALEPLKAVVQLHPAEIAPYLNYARTLLALHRQGVKDISLEEAIQTIRQALEIQPDDAESTAALAEALAAGDQLLPAMEAYRKALESEIAQEPRWQARLSLGLGEVAHKLGQIETAIAALQEASQADPADAHIQRSLSEAYDAAGLSEEAYQAARAALLLAPGDVDNLNWFAGQAINLKDRPGASTEALGEAIDALEKATQLAPQRGDLWVRLAQMQLASGDQDAARDTLMNLADPQGLTAEASTRDLYQAAQGLARLDQAKAAAICLERALQNGAATASADPNAPSLLDMLTALSSARYQSGDVQAALQAMDQAIALDPDEPNLHLEKADMLLELGQAEGDSEAGNTNADEALASLVTAIRLNPHDPDLQYRAALIHRAAGDLSAALKHADQMVELSRSVCEAMKARALAADLSLGMLQTAQARTYLDGPLPPSEPAEQIEDGVMLEYYALRAETALEAGDERGAVEELVRVLEIAPDHPRLLAIQARIIHHREDQASAADVLENVLKAIGDPTHAEAVCIRSAAEAAIDQSQWEVALKLYAHLIAQIPWEPRSHLDLARTLVLQAEFTAMCRALDAIRRAGGGSSEPEETQQAFEQTLAKAEELVGRLDGKQAQASAKHSSKWADPNVQIQRWRARGQAAFHPSPEAADMLASLAPHPDNAAARVACLRHTGDLITAGLAARDYPQHPLVLLQLGLALSQEKPRQAMAAIHAAAEALSDPAATRKHRSAFCTKELAPLVYALMARLFHCNGNRAGDRESALTAINNALSLWGDESRWHVLAAEIYLAAESVEESDPDDLDGAIHHLEQAIKLEPENTASLLVLGQIYLREGSTQKAARAFEAAAEAEPDEPEPWVYLARAHRSLGDLEQAAAHAERAVTLAPNQVQPLLLRGEIALQANNPRGAQSRAQAALRVQPDDPDALLLLARSLNALDRPEEALATLEKALPLASEPLPLSIERVRLLHRAHGHEAAIQAAQTLADHNPEEPRVLALQAELLESAGQNEAAIRAAQRALRMPDKQSGAANELPKGEQARLHYMLGRMLRRTGQLDQAVHHLTETIRLAPDMVEAYLEIGHVHQERREHNQALNAYRQAITVAPHDHRPYYLIGQALKESKDYLCAERMLRRAADLAPEDVSIHRLLGAVVALNLVHNRRETAPDVGLFGDPRASKRNF